MKTSVKIITASLGAAAILSAGIFGTFAYLTAQDKVANTFTVGNIQMSLDEKKVDTEGATVSNASRVTTNAYHLIPGSSYTKDPTVHILPNSEASIVFVHVVNDISAIEATDSTIASQILANGWTAVEGKAGYYYQYVDATGTSPKDLTVFESFKIANVDNSTLAGYADTDITVTAFAIQQKNMSLANAITQFPTNF